MELNVKYFGMVAEWTGSASGPLEFDGHSVADLKEQLEARIPQLKDITYQVAVNQKIVGNRQLLQEHDDLAVLPPFAGG